MNVSEVVGGGLAQDRNVKSLQEIYGPRSTCFGCGPANTSGLRIRSFAQHDKVVADWRALPHHEAFPNVLNGGIIGALLDCHSNWAAAWHLMNKNSLAHVPYTVTVKYGVEFHSPTPTNEVIHLVARVVESTLEKAVVDAELMTSIKVHATFRGTFVSVKPGHPAYGRW